MAEYYDDRTLAPRSTTTPSPSARSTAAAGPNRNEQIQAQQAGAQRTANIQNNINAYGRPYGAMGAGLGYGLGLGGAGLYTYPYRYDDRRRIGRRHARDGTAAAIASARVKRLA